MQRKRLFPFILLIVALFLLSACSEGDDVASQDGDQPVDGDTILPDGDSDTIDGDDDASDGDNDASDGDNDATDGDNDATDGDDDAADGDDDAVDGDDDATDGDDDATDGDDDATDGDDETDGDDDATDGDDVPDGDDDAADGDVDPDPDPDPEPEIPACPHAFFDIDCDGTFSHNTFNDGVSSWSLYGCDAGQTNNGPEVLYRFTASEDCDDVHVQLRNMTTNLDLFLLNGCGPTYCGDVSNSAGIEDIHFQALAGETYYFAVDSTQFQAGSFDINVVCTCELPDGDLEDDGDENPQALFDLGPIDGLTPYFDFTNGNDMFMTPYPNDAWHRPNGTIIIPGFPNPFDPFTESESWAIVVFFSGLTQSLLTGFGNNSPVYYTFPEPIDTTSMPDYSGNPPSISDSVLLIDVDPDSDWQGELIPVEWHWTATATDFEPHDNILAVAPFDGFPLRPATTYAMILTDGVTDTDGHPLGRTQYMADLYSGKENDWVGQAYRPFVEWLYENQATLDPQRVRAVTVFTTQDPVEETKRMADYVRTEYPDGAIQGELLSCALDNTYNGYYCFEGTYTSPNFQSGTKPYDIGLDTATPNTENGMFRFDEFGDPIVQEMETLDYSLCIPADTAVPASGWPITLIAHGTGGTYNGYVGSGPNTRSTRLLNEKIATIGIDQPLHGSRGDNYTTQELELYTFNVTSPHSSRSIIRQGALDSIALAAFIQAGKLDISSSNCTGWPAAWTSAGLTSIGFNAGKILFHGHSQGGLTGAIVAGVDEDVFKGYVLSGAGGRIGITVMERQEPNVLAQIEASGLLTAAEAHKHHPLIALVQMLVEVTDQINYAPNWTDTPFGDNAKNIMMTSGYLDPYTPRLGADALAAAGRIPQIRPEGWNVPPLDMRNVSSFPRPASNTVTGPDGNPATSGYLQYPDGGHFVVFDTEDAMSVYAEFLRTIVYTTTPTLGD